MAIHDQLEVITADGVIEFYDLLPEKGVTNVGSHPENDVVLQGPNVAPFHLMVDHRQAPCQVMVLAEEFPAQKDGRPLPVLQAISLQNWDAVELGGHTLILLQGKNGATTSGVDGRRSRRAAPPRRDDVSAGQSPRQPAPSSTGEPTVTSSFQQPSPSAPGVVPPGVSAAFASSARIADARPDVSATQPGSGISTTANGARAFIPTPVRDHTDDFILTELAERELVADVEQTVAYQLTVTNGGDLVASFNVQVEGVDPEWVVILPAQVNLLEQESGIVTITITPPRLPSSAAGRHNLSITVTTPEYPERYSQLGATLTINPYHDVQIGELAVRRQTVSWSNPVAENAFAVENRGNSPTQVQVDAQDDERKLHFEFQIMGEDVVHARQAELRLEPGEASEVNLFIEPNNRPFISLRNRLYQYDVRATPLGGQQFPRTIGGQIKVVPLIGKALITLFLFLMAAIVIVVFSPKVESFEVTWYTTPPAPGTPTPVLEYGMPVALSWEGKRFSRVSVSGPDLPEMTPSNSGQVIIPEPVGTPVYVAQARTFLSDLLFGYTIHRGQDVVERQIEVKPVQPVVTVELIPERVNVGEPVTLRWHVERADQAFLDINGVVEQLPTASFSGERVLTPDAPLTVKLDASNPSSRLAQQDAASALAQGSNGRVSVVTPTATPVPPPEIVVFDANPRAVVEGMPATLEWQVLNVNSVIIDGVQLPAQGSREVFPEPPLQNYVLSASNEGGELSPRQITIDVTPAPTPTPLPQAPQIVSFVAEPKEYVLESEDPVKLSWVVRGEFTDLEITAPDMELPKIISSTGSINVRPTESKQFVLTATNVDQSSAAVVEVPVLEPTPTPTPLPTATPTATPPPTPTPVPSPNIVFFGAESSNPSDLEKVRQINNNTYEIEVGALVKLTWSVLGATNVELVGKHQGSIVINYGSRPFEGELNLQYDGSIDQFELSARNVPEGAENMAASSTSTISVEFVELIPGAPYALSGSVQEGQNVLQWQYDSADLELIEAFRIYRADVANMNFLSVAEVDPNTRSWTDPDVPGCGKAYFVVATYRNVDGDILQTDPTSTSWFSPSC